MHITRRGLLRTAAACSLVSLANASEEPAKLNGLKVLVTGGHPGDPECGCVGTIARYTSAGADVALLYLNRGEGYCSGFDPTQCGAVRTQEAQKACALLKARALFAGQIDGQAVVDKSHYEQAAKQLASEKPDVLFLQWPVDKHRDHRALSALMLDAWLTNGKPCALYYYEVADDTMMFSPTQFVDISAPQVESVRRAACFAHASQRPEVWYAAQTQLTRFRGTQSGHSQAEAFLLHWESRPGALPA